MPRYGIWAFQHGVGGGQPDAPHFYEMDRAKEVTCVTLALLTEGDALGKVLHRGYFHVLRQSYTRTLEAVLVPKARPTAAATASRSHCFPGSQKDRGVCSAPPTASYHSGRW